MDAKKVAERLEGYERKAYESGDGLDWLSDIGENVTYYMQDCDKEKVKPTIEGLIAQIDKMYEKAEF